jgi:hypothetical protein
MSTGSLLLQSPPRVRRTLGVGFYPSPSESRFREAEGGI